MYVCGEACLAVHNSDVRSMLITYVRCWRKPFSAISVLVDRGGHAKSGSLIRGLIPKGRPCNVYYLQTLME
jgi:hypothetical protein